MDHIYKKIFKSSIKVGDTVCIKVIGSSEEDLANGIITKLLSTEDDSGIKVEIETYLEKHTSPTTYVGYVEFVYRDGNIEYGSM